MKLGMASYIFPVTGEISAQPGDDQGDSSTQACHKL